MIHTPRWGNVPVVGLAGSEPTLVGSTSLARAQVNRCASRTTTQQAKTVDEDCECGEC